MVVGNNVTVKCGVQLWNGIEIGNNVFIGANVSYMNEKYPKSRKKDWRLFQARICEGISNGTCFTVLPRIIIGKKSMTGDGRGVTKNVFIEG